MSTTAAPTTTTTTTTTTKIEVDAKTALELLEEDDEFEVNV